VALVSFVFRVETHHKSFTPSCSCLGVFACDVTLPKELDVTLVFGEPNCTRLSALNASMRAPCERTRSSVRERNHLVLIYRSSP